MCMQIITYYFQFGQSCFVEFTIFESCVHLSLRKGNLEQNSAVCNHMQRLRVVRCEITLMIIQRRSQDSEYGGLTVREALENFRFGHAH